MTSDLVGSVAPLNPCLPPEAKAEPSPGPKQSVFREVPWRGSEVIIGLAPDICFFLAGVLINPTWLWVGPHWLWLPMAAVLMAWMFFYPIWIVRRRARLPHLPRPRTVLMEAMFALLATAVIMFVSVAVFSLLFSLFGDRALTTMPHKPFVASPHWYDPLGILVLAFILAPVAEEVFFRGMLYNWLRRRLPVVVAAPVQAIVFGVSHHFGPADTAGVVLMGLGFALLYEWRKTLLAPVLMHAMVNAVAMAIMAQSIAADAAAPRLGVYGETHEQGVLLKDVVPGSAADTAGLRVGDLIVRLDGEPVADFASLTRAVRNKQVGQNVVIEFIREGQTHRVDAVLKKLRE
jgi:membrane protease YdiL (CAAX protease family)